MLQWGGDEGLPIFGCREMQTGHSNQESLHREGPSLHSNQRP